MSSSAELLTREQELVALAQLSNWQILETTDIKSSQGLKRELCRFHTFSSFELAMDFMRQAAVVVSRLDHHPHWCNTYNRVEIRLTTFSLGNQVSDLDVKLALAMESLLAQSATA